MENIIINKNNNNNNQQQSIEDDTRKCSPRCEQVRMTSKLAFINLLEILFV